MHGRAGGGGLGRGLGRVQRVQHSAYGQHSARSVRAHSHAGRTPGRLRARAAPGAARNLTHAATPKTGTRAPRAAGTARQPAHLVEHRVFWELDRIPPPLLRRRKKNVVTNTCGKPGVIQE